jgi:hypothetical protein
MTYNDKLDTDLQIDAEEEIADLVFNASGNVFPNTLHEEDCADLGRKILKVVLKKFRPDLIGGG